MRKTMLRMLLTAGVLAYTLPTLAQESTTPGMVLAEQKISDTQGGFTAFFHPSQNFGWTTEGIGDLDGDGVNDLAVGAISDRDGGQSRGAIWVLFLNADGTVKSYQKISDTQGGFFGVLENYDHFGDGIAALGDLDGNGVNDLAVGASGDNDGGTHRGCVWILFMNANGTVSSYQKISDTAGGFTGLLDNYDRFGESVASLGDLDGDGVDDLAVGARLDDTGFSQYGAVWILFLNADGTVKSHQKVGSATGGFTGTLNHGDEFGRAVANLGDLDGDGVTDLVVGASNDDDGGDAHGAVWVLFLNADGTVKGHQKISDTAGGFAGVLESYDLFGYDVTAVDDLDGDGVTDLAVGAYGDDDGGNARGAVWVLFLNTDGTVKGHQKLSDTEGGFTGTLDDSDAFGTAVANLGDLDGDGFDDLAVGANGDDDGGTYHGAVWVLLLDGSAGTSLTVDATPVSGYPVPAAGGVLRFSGTITNTGTEATTTDIWAIAANDSAGVEQQLGPAQLGVPLAAGESLAGTQRQAVPANAPAGLYTITVYAGTYPDGAVASAAFTVEKLSAARVSAQVRTGAESVRAVPNPFQAQTTLAFTLTEAANVRLAVYDILGREVAVLAEGSKPAGDHRVSFEASRLPAGVYVWKLEAGGATQTGQVTRLD